MKSAVCYAILFMALSLSTLYAGVIYDYRGNEIGTTTDENSLVPRSAPSSDEDQMVQNKYTQVVNNDNGLGFILGFGGGVALPTTNFDPSYQTAVGGDFTLGLALDKNWALLLMTDFYAFNTAYNGFAVYNIDAIPTLRYSFGEGDIRPYLFAGAGLNEDWQDEGAFGTTYSTTSAAAGGFGLSFALSKHAALYLQGKYTAVFTASGSYSYLPVSLGLEFN